MEIGVGYRGLVRTLFTKFNSVDTGIKGIQLKLGLDERSVTLDIKGIKIFFLRITTYEGPRAQDGARSQKKNENEKKGGTFFHFG